MAKITIERSNEYANYFRAIKIYIDGEYVGNINKGESIEYDVEEGQHTVKAKIDWCGSKEYTVDAKSDDEQVLYLRGYKGFKYLSILVVAMMAFLLLDDFFSIEWLRYIAGALCIIGFAWFIYLFTIGRNNYLLFESKYY